MKSRDSMVLYRSFYDAIKLLPNDIQLEIFKAIFEYGLDGYEPELSIIAKPFWLLIKPNLLANRTKWESGCKAKQKQSRSKNEAEVKQEVSKAEAEAKQEVSKTEANVDVDVDENENEEVSNKLDIKPKAKRKKEKVQFVPPTIEEVKDFFTEKGYPLQLVDKVFNHYNDKQWHKSNGHPVIDWKATIRNNWEDHFQSWRQRQTSNASSNNSQLPVAPSQIVNYGKGNGKCFFDKKSGLWYEPLMNGYLPKEVSDYYYYDQGNHSNYGDYVRWMIENGKTPLPPEDTRYFPADWNFEKFVSEQRAIVASSNS